MIVTRSTKCSLKFTNVGKLETLKTVLKEYSAVVNKFIQHFWNTEIPKKNQLLKPLVGIPITWLSARLRKVAAREAIGMCMTAKGNEHAMPIHNGKQMHLSEAIVEFKQSKNTFDGWLHFSSIGSKIGFDIPIKLHKHFHKLNNKGKLAKSIVINENYVQFCFEINTGSKLETGKCIGIDTGVKVLASTSEGRMHGTDIEQCINRINRCKHGSAGQKTARRALKQRMDEVARDIVSEKPRLVVVEQLKGISVKTKVRRRLNKNMRRVIGSWAWSYWLNRLQQNCEIGCSSFRSVYAANTSITCPACGHIDKRNRKSQEVFCCCNCGHSDNADINAAKNILVRFLTGPYGAGFRAKMS